MLIIMIGGPARVGKTTLAKWLSEYAYNEGYTPVILPFAQALKDEAEKRGYSKDKNPEEYRAFCQTLGSEARNEDQDFWVKKFKEKIKFMYEQEQKALAEDPDTWHEKVIIVDDCRYMNEVATARDLKALTIFISAGDRELPEAKAEWRTHESEAMANALEQNDKNYTEVFDYVVRNAFSERQYKNKVTEKFEEWFHILSEGLVGNLCSCEMCIASREDRDPDADRVIQHILDIILGEKNDGKT
jgi:guanylate kinase